MSTVITVYSELKNTDLHALSAFEAITQFLYVSTLKRLRRVQKWTFVLSQPQDEALQIVETLLNQSYLVVNINKESYRFSEASHPLLHGHHLFQVAIESPHIDAPAIQAKLNNRFGCGLSRLHHQTIWELLVEDSRDPKIVSDDIYNTVVVSRSFEKGLLVNPLIESFTFTQLNA